MSFVDGFARWLKRSDPLAPADAIVVPGDMPVRDRLFAALEVLSRGFAPRILVSQPGLGHEHFWAVVAAEREELEQDPRIIAQSDRIVWVPSRALSTYEEALALRPKLVGLGCRSTIVVTSSFHTRRAREIFSRALAADGIEVRSYGVPTPPPGNPVWWKSGEMRSLALSEPIKLLSTLLHLDPILPRGLRLRLNIWIMRIIP